MIGPDDQPRAHEARRVRRGIIVAIVVSSAGWAAAAALVWLVMR